MRLHHGALQVCWAVIVNIRLQALPVIKVQLDQNQNYDHQRHHHHHHHHHRHHHYHHRHRYRHPHNLVTGSRAFNSTLMAIGLQGPIINELDHGVGFRVTNMQDSVVNSCWSVRGPLGCSGLGFIRFKIEPSDGTKG